MASNKGAKNSIVAFERRQWIGRALDLESIVLHKTKNRQLTEKVSFLSGNSGAVKMDYSSDSFAYLLVIMYDFLWSRLWYSIEDGNYDISTSQINLIFHLLLLEYGFTIIFPALVAKNLKNSRPLFSKNCTEFRNKYTFVLVFNTSQHLVHDSSNGEI